MSQNDKVDIPYIDYTRLITCILYEVVAAALWNCCTIRA